MSTSSPEIVASCKAHQTTSMRPDQSEQSNLTLDTAPEDEEIVKRAPNKKQFRCEHCSINFTRKCSLLRHKRRSCSAGTTEFWTEKKNIIEGQSLYSCNVCSYRSKWKIGIMKHLDTHSEYNRFRCPIKGCKYWAEQPQAMEEHSSIVHHIKELLPKTYLQTQENLRLAIEGQTEAEVHVNRSSSMAFACMLCSFIGDSELSAFEHARQHTAVHFSLE